ncbi:hypothetical protein CYCD_20790 [Tenuifilaceae bacterium CYCD]|nr:hypothetical protein CYCD_20790 [Tenuifilaceae bacterium CYCD]
MLQAQNTNSDFKTTVINKKIIEYLDRFDLSSVLSTLVTLKYTEANGRDGLYRSICLKRNISYWPESNSINSAVPEKKRMEILNQEIKEIITYKDSVACSILRKDSAYRIRYYELDNGDWLVGAEDVRYSMEDARKLFHSLAEGLLQAQKRSKLVLKMPTDTLSFLDYIDKNKKDPTDFILDALKRYKIVVYGEIHNRPPSWELCRDVIRSKSFSENAGTIFLELSAHKQQQIDLFLESKTLDVSLIQDVFHETFDDQFWAGMYDFLIDVWNINQDLNSNSKIRVIAVDIPRPYSFLRTSDDFLNHFQKFESRDSFMAETIENYLNKSTDKRNSLFIVGAMHVCKSFQSAGSLLTNKFSNDSVYSIFTHCPIISNDGNIPGLIRGGIFDYAFYKYGNTPIAFSLKNSPFGKEPFDAFTEISYSNKTGCFSDNFDAYIFLGSLSNEITDRILFEVYTPDFISELKRRCDLQNLSFKEYYGISEPNRASLISILIKEKEPYRWRKSIIHFLKNNSY